MADDTQPFFTDEQIAALSVYLRGKYTPDHRVESFQVLAIHRLAAAVERLTIEENPRD